MNIDNKKELINNQKIKLESLIKESLIQLPINFNYIKSNLNEHFNFIKFIELMGIYENYKWEKIKENYNKIKKKYNIDKKLYSQIIKIYGIVSSYYSFEESNDINNFIKKINEDNNTNIIEWEKLKMIHYILTNKRKNYVRNTIIIKIYNTNNEIKELIDKLYEINIKLSLFRKEINILKGCKF
jgi:hypothetical protein